MNQRQWRWILSAGGFCVLLTVSILLIPATSHGSKASSLFARWHKKCPGACAEGGCGEPGGTWYWLHSPEEEKRIISGLYNRYCIRCHGVDGRGVWDIPGVPDFTNTVWQASRSDADLARIILEGRGAVMPPFRGTLSLEEAWAMARYLRTLVPGTETPRPDSGPSKK